MSQPRFTTVLPTSDHANVLSPLPIGTQIGDYLLGAVLGRGGFGITYEATEMGTGKSVAVKEFFPTGCARAQSGDGSEWEIRSVEPNGREAFAVARKQFLEGARALQSVRHLSLARVRSHLEAHNTVYLVMERLQGRTLQQLVEEFGPFSQHTALQIARDLGEALDAMHRLGFLHLDVKPENVMACDCETNQTHEHPASTCSRVVLFDFDLLQRIEGSGGLGTRPLTFHCGTPGYAPLEQYAQNAQLSPATDLYALGATVFHLLTAQAPPAATDRALNERLSNENSALSPLAMGCEVDEKFDNAIGWALEMTPRERPQKVSDWLEAVENGRPQLVATPVIDDSDAAFLMNAPIAPTANSITVTMNGAGFNALSAPHLPPAPVLPPLPMVDGWYQLVAKDLEFDWPHECACCGKTPDAYLPIKAGGTKWEIPYCRRCARHIRAARQAVWGTAWGMVGGLAIAFVGWALSDMWLGPFGVMLHFGAMFYGSLKVQEADAIMRSSCCDRNKSVSFGGVRDTVNGKRFLVRFLNLAYAHQWKARNVGKL